MRPDAEAGTRRRHGDRDVGEVSTLGPQRRQVDRDLLARFRAVIREKYPDARVLLFGSRARGQSRPNSDYDLIILSPAFAGVSPLWRGQGLSWAWAELDAQVDVDILCYTPEEYESASQRPTSWLSEAAAEAIEV